MKKLFLLGLWASIVAATLCSCDKTPENVNPYDELVGTYDLLVVTDSLSADGQWYSNEYYGQITGEPEEDMQGTLTIALTPDGNGISLLGMIDLGDGELQPLYNTSATLDADNNLVIAANDYTAPTGVTVHLDYRKCENRQPLVFRNLMSIAMAGYDFAYLMTNTATKR